MNFISKFRALNFFAGFGFATLGTMLIPFLLSKGFSYKEIGFISSLITLSALTSNYTMGYLCDKFGTIKRLYTPSVCIASIFVVFMFTVNSKPLFILSYMCFAFFQSAIFNLNDSWVIEYNEDCKRNFGSIRSFCSLGWSLSSLCIGYLIDLSGFYIIGFIIVIMLLGLFLVSIRTKDCEKAVSNINPTDFLKLIKMPKYTSFLLCLLVYGIAHASIMYLPSYLIKNLGGGNSDIGLYYFLSAGFEVILLLFSVKILKKISAEKLLIICSSTLVIRLILMLLAPNLIILHISALFHMITFGAFLISSKNIIDKLTPATFKTTGQMLWAIIYGSFATIISSTLTGFLMDSVGLKATVSVFIVISMISTLLLILYNSIFKASK